MYEELVKQCRDCVEALCGECKYKHLLKPGNFVTCTNALITEAANAIEELVGYVQEAERDRDEYRERLDKAADAIEELEKQLDEETEYATVLNSYVPQWISVTDQLPDRRESVLALTGDCDIYVCDYIPSVKQFWTIPGDELHIDDITHWMPLPPSPEPPKEET